MKRGEIYFIQRHETMGSEIAKARPGIIVSNNALNGTSTVVEVVYLTTAPKKDLPTHAVITATGRCSTAICEHIDHISKELIGDFCGEVSEEEMEAVDRALLFSLGIETLPSAREPIYEKHLVEAVGQLERLKAERDRYAKMVDHLLGVEA